MALPVLNQRSGRTEGDLIRLFQQTEGRLTEHLAEPAQLEIGTAYANAELADVYAANNVRDVALPDGMIPAQAFEMVEAHYAHCGSRCAYWTMNVSSPELRTKPMVDYLLGRGHRERREDVMLLGQIPAVGVPTVEGVKVIPARASFRHVRELFAETAVAHQTPNLVEAAMLHLDDPHWDALLALREAKAAGYVGVLAMGEVGRIEQLYIAEGERGQGLGLLMLARAIEICARSLFKHVMLSVRPDNSAAKALYAKLGFHPIGSVKSYFAPWAGAGESL